MKNLLIILLLFTSISCKETVKKSSYDIVEIEYGFVGEIYKDDRWYFVYLDSNCYELSLSNYTYESDSNYLKERIKYIMEKEGVEEYFIDEVY